MHMAWAFFYHSHNKWVIKIHKNSANFQVPKYATVYVTILWPYGAQVKMFKALLLYNFWFSFAVYLVSPQNNSNPEEGKYLHFMYAEPTTQGG